MDSNIHSGNPLDNAPKTIAWDISKISRPRGPPKKLIKTKNTATSPSNNTNLNNTIRPSNDSNLNNTIGPSNDSNLNNNIRSSDSNLSTSVKNYDLIPEPVAVKKNEVRLPPGPEAIILNEFTIVPGRFFDQHNYVYKEQNDKIICIGKFVPHEIRLLKLTEKEQKDLQLKLNVLYEYDNNIFVVQ